MALLENMRIFVRVVELGSLSAAGRSVRMSPAVVSNRIRQLEEQLGVRLLNRTTRQLQLTETGQAYYDGCLEVMDAVERAQNGIAKVGAAPSGSLRVTAPLGFGRRVLAPMVPLFRAGFPLIETRLRLSDHLLDLLHEGIDVAIRMAVLEDSSLVVRKLGELRRVLCAAPAYLDAHGRPERPEDLLHHNCLLLRFPGSKQFKWTLTTADGPVKLAVAGYFDADDGDVLTRWAIDGHGIVMKPVWEVADALRSGALIPVLPDVPPVPVTLAVLYPHRNLLPAKVRAFTDFFVERARAALLSLAPDSFL